MSPPRRRGEKEEKLKRARTLSVEQLRTRLFGLFEQTPRWSMKALITQTNQPQVCAVWRRRALSILTSLFASSAPLTGCVCSRS